MKAYLVTTPREKAVYESGRDALGVFETPRGEYKADSYCLIHLVPVTPTNIAVLLRKLDHMGYLTFRQEGCRIDVIDFHESHGAK